MTSFWTGERVRLRGVEPEDWETFMRFDGFSQHQRSVDMIYPPRSTEGYRAWAAERAVAKPSDDRFMLAIEALDSGEFRRGGPTARARVLRRLASRPRADGDDGSGVRPPVLVR